MQQPLVFLSSFVFACAAGLAFVSPVQAQTQTQEQAQQQAQQQGENQALSRSQRQLQQRLLELPPVYESNVVDLPTHEFSYTFRELGSGRPLRIDGMATTLSLGFGSRADQISEGGTLYLNYQYSPTLVRDISQFRVRFNGELVRAVRVNVAEAEQRHQLRVSLPAEYFSDYNEITFELLAEAHGDQCSVVSPSAWLEFSGDSRIEFNRRQLVLANELSWFPEPFFDVRDFTRAEFHYVIPERMDTNIVQAAGIFTSYFGAQADWRSVSTELYRYRNDAAFEHEVHRWPDHHAIVFLTNDERPWLFRDYPEVSEPTVRMITNPVNQVYKMLLVQAPDTAGLITAAQGLVTHPAGLTGPQVSFNAEEVQYRLQPRDAYSAPRWISTKEPVTFSELVEFDNDLQRTGYRNSPVSVNLRLPPDLFVWQRKGIPVDLKFRYTPPIELDESRLRVYINDDFIRGYTLNQSGFGGASERIRVPLLDSNPFTQPALNVPAFKLGAINRLDFEFSFSARSEECRVRPIGNTMGAIDGDSSIDIRGYEHYTEMPNLQLFAKTGYPFSRYDDLANSILVVSDSPTDEEFIAAMQALALIGSATGYPGTLLEVMQVADVPENTRADILISGGPALRAWLQRFGRATLDKQLGHHGLAGEQQLFFGDDEAATVSGPSAAVVSFQSPLHSSATVVALTANQDDFLNKVTELLRSSERTMDVSGFMSLLTPGNDRHLPGYELYYVGELSFFKRMYFHLARYPVLVSVLTLVALVTLVMVLYWFFSGLARRRLERRGDV
ncbi:hypothetical protein CWE08_09435 [Aliidiomarina iranensis]|uniref:Cyclic di-GMP-binding protein n=1 Tax=Aliidiomarina iranensis TaxID=1434071 RepID=A0A432VTA7_9GAMM|nr:cellulose biosynthesis cyclic di-GMP-binding regulatory protein BcsB [Aliidiomarina iranensis]RUO19644.1 hypothetical protein CWE08_09435 [Aliidiomarina iranensis]